MGPIRPVRAIDDPWQDGDHVGTDDDKEELGGVPAVIWRGLGLRSPRAATDRGVVAAEAQFRSVARSASRPGRVGGEGRSAGRVRGTEAWLVELEMKSS